METPIDILQIKIERAKESLPKETLKAIDSVDWKAFILSMREKKGYSFEQLEDLELETELLLCGLLAPENYPKELETRMQIPKSQINLLINEMNEAVFQKIKDELIKNTERKEIFVKKTENIGNAIPPQGISTPAQVILKPNADGNETISKKESGVLNKAGINIEAIPGTPNPSLGNTEKPMESISSQKLSGSFQIPTTKTEYSLNNISKKEGPAEVNSSTASEKIKLSKIDPYRIDPNE